MKILLSFLVLIFFFTNIQAQEIEATLSGNTSAEGFSVKNLSGTTLFRVNGLGNIGIGTTSPTTLLQLGSFSGGDVFISLKSAGGNQFRNGIKLRQFNDLGGGFDIVNDEQILGLNFIRHFFNGVAVDSATAMFIDKLSGNVGIGTTSPAYKLDVNGPVNASSLLVNGVAVGGGHYIGESYGGGIVFYVYDNGQHGLIAATADQSTGIQWRNSIDRSTGATGNGFGAGTMNTAIVIATQIADDQVGNFAAKVCADHSGDSYGDWYLPSLYELSLLYLQKDVVGGFANTRYWSSSEINSSFVWDLEFTNGNQYSNVKTSPDRVRAIRNF